MLATIIINLLRDLHCPKSKSNKTPYELFIEDKEQIKEIYINENKVEGSFTPEELNEKMSIKWDNMSNEKKYFMKIWQKINLQKNLQIQD